MLHVEHEERVVISLVTKRAGNWLASARLRPTKQRMALAEALVGDGHHRHVTAESLFERVQRTGDRVSLATVYNTLRAFCDAAARGRRSRSYFDTNTHDHPHFAEVHSD